MIVNLLLVAFVILMAVWFGSQGLFSAILHLVVTLVAGSLALAVWEPLTVGYLLERMPEYAWGVGLLAPFVLLMVGLRVAADKLAPGNVDFHNLVNLFVGGAVGVIIGLVTAGFLVIGLQFISTGVPGYQPYRLGAAGRIERFDTLWLPADTFAGSVFAGLSTGPFSPTLSDATVSNRQPRLAVSAGLFQITARQNARKAIRPGSVTIDRFFEINPSDAPYAQKPAGDQRVYVVGMEIAVNQAADQDGQFTASAAQLPMLAVNPIDSSSAQLILPHGWVHRVGEAYGTLHTPGDRLWTKSADTDMVDVIYHVPAGLEPRFVRVKQLRLDLPDESAVATEDIVGWIENTRWTRPKPQPDLADVDSNDLEPGAGPGAEVEALKVGVGGRLPMPLNLNTLTHHSQNLRMTDDNAIISATGQINYDRMDRPHRNLVVDRIHSPSAQRIVRIEMTASRARSLLGKAMQLAARTQTPMLVDEDGYTYRAVGAIRVSEPVIHLDIDTTRTIDYLGQIRDIDQLSGDDTLILYFRVSRGSHLVEFRIGNASEQTLDVNVE